MKKLTFEQQCLIFIILLLAAMLIAGTSDYKEAVATEKYWKEQVH